MSLESPSMREDQLGRKCKRMLGEWAWFFHGQFLGFAVCDIKFGIISMSGCYVHYGAFCDGDYSELEFLAVPRAIE